MSALPDPTHLAYRIRQSWEGDNQPVTELFRDDIKV